MEIVQGVKKKRLEASEDLSFRAVIGNCGV
jgi:hypothetical protein